ncbi:hypothetical protein BOTBODRAFT_55936 [Botryobasidium botryosum FD-172 SS1]|uniref:Sphingolipid long chain base-responsive protein LSP1 n=1 Tax=Botryobasidium botryosum (strain FD-172 SS1) TaxID=930990 RepID=A0A067MQ25_BOTB1|nr:hypothetical protein BOTBODRAFT_55936 [Botryobasidium botryosum FD-172 SS1]
MPRFLDSLAGKAEKAFNNLTAGTPLQSQSGGVGHEQIDPGLAQANYGQSSGRHHAIENIQHSIRALNYQYNPQIRGEKRQLLLTISAQKGVALDLSGLGRDSQMFSKEYYHWGQEQGEDLKDVTDRLAYLNFVSGSLASQLAQSLEHSRNSLKMIRDAENALIPRRNARAALQAQITKLEHDGGRAPGADKKIAELRAQLDNANRDDEHQERELEDIKRRAILDGETAKWDAFREFGEKTVMLAQASRSLLAELPEHPPTPQNPYRGGAQTAAIRSTLQRALEGYQLGTDANFPGSPTGLRTDPFSDPVDRKDPNLLNPIAHPSFDDKSDSRSFGETHKNELDRIPSISSQTGHNVPGQQAQQPGVEEMVPGTSPPTTAFYGHGFAPHSTSPLSTPHPAGSGPSSISSGLGAPIPMVASPYSGASPAPIDTIALNNAPAVIPPTRDGETPKASSPVVTLLPQSSPVVNAPPGSAAEFATSPPTVAETGVPLTGGQSGPGPASGTLSPRKGSDVLPSGPQSFADGPFRQSDATPHSQTASSQQQPPSIPPRPQSQYESAEEEKKRLQREDREKVLAGGSASPAAQGQSQGPFGPGQQPKHETAEEEKKRLEREERERVLSGNSGANAGAGGPGYGKNEKEDDNIPPPYNEDLV